MPGGAGPPRPRQPAADVPSLDLLALIVQGGAVVVLSLWVWDLRAQNSALRKELKGFTDDVRAALRKAK